MGIYVQGMEMPEKCGLCDLFHAESPMHCTVVKGNKTVGAQYGMPRPDWCPLVDLGKHGRLIDADAFKTDYGMSDDCDSCDTNWKSCQYDTVYAKMDFCGCLDDAPTVIEAEDE